MRQPAVTVYGLRSLDRAMKDLAPDLRREFYSSVGSTVKAVARAQQAAYQALNDLDNSPIGKSAADIAASVKVRRGASSRRARAAAFGFRIQQEHGYGVMVETVRNYKTPQGRELANMLNRRFGSPGRFMWRVMDERRDDVNRAVTEAARAAEHELQRRVDALGEGSK